jgi:hypothetical protein
VDALRDWILEQPALRDWVFLEPRPCSRCWESEVEVERSAERLKAEVEYWKQLSASLCDYANAGWARVAELSRGRRTVADRAALLADLPFSPTVEQKQAVADKHGVKLHRVTTLVREAGLNSPARVRRKFSRDF